MKLKMKNSEMHDLSVIVNGRAKNVQSSLSKHNNVNFRKFPVKIEGKRTSKFDFRAKSGSKLIM